MHGYLPKSGSVLASIFHCSPPFNWIARNVIQFGLPPLGAIGIAFWFDWAPDLPVTLLTALALFLYYAILSIRHAYAIYDLSHFTSELADGKLLSPPVSIRFGTPGLCRLAQNIERLYRIKSDENEAMRQLIEARDRVLDAVPDPVFALAADGRILAANRGALTNFGSMIGGEITVLFRQPTIQAALRSVVTGNEEQVTTTLSLAPPVEREFTVAIQSLHRVASDGAAAVMALHDVTALRRAEQTRVDFVANASHEIRTPLTTLLGFIETLQGPAKDDPSAQEMFLDIMNGEALRMARLVEDLLSLSRIEQHEHEHPTTALALGPLLERVIAGLRFQAEQRRASITLKIEGEDSVIGSADELVQLAQNLIVNALKYGQEGGRVTVTVQPKTPAPVAMPPSAHGALVLMVRDDGEGIAREHLPRLTERFYRVDPARSKSQGGTGLGLAIVKHILNRHRGMLRIESEPGAGTCVFAYLPAAKPVEPDRTQKAREKVT